MPLEDSKPFLAFDNRDGNGQPIAGNMCQFHSLTVENKRLSAEQGRTVHEEKHFIDIWAPAMHTQRGSFQIIPGLNGHGGNKYYQTYYKEYDAWVKGNSTPDSGTPLNELSFLSKAAVADLASMKIHSAEQLAAVNDGALGSLPASFLSYRNKAKAYLEQAAGMAPFTKMQAQIDALTEQLAAEKADKLNLAAAQAAQPERKKLTLGKGEAA